MCVRNTVSHLLRSYADTTKYAFSIECVCIMTSSEHADGKFVAEIPNPAVDETLLEEIWCMKSHGMLS